MGKVSYSSILALIVGLLSMGSIVYGYPSVGGVLITSASPVELAYLGVDRFDEAQRSTNQVEEDEFCRRLRRLGATWWANSAAEMDASSAYAGNEAAHRRWGDVVATGWPSNGKGVWVLKFNLEDFYQRRHEMPTWYLRQTLNMDERCAVIKRLGGTCYQDPDDCEELRWDTMKMAQL